MTEADISEESLGEICIKQVMSVSDPDDEEKKDDKDGGKETVIAKKGENIADKHKSSGEKKSTKDESGKSEKDKNRKVKISGGKPLVIIYHTHSSESYMP